jgi:uncharacterized protein (DUF2147 family)
MESKINHGRNARIACAAIAASFGLVVGTSALADAASPVGTWTTIDDATGKPRSVVEITEHNGELQGQVKQVLNRTPEDIARDGDPPLCKDCEGERKNQPIVGMVILWGVKKDGDAWDGGRILDPANGKTYKVRITPVHDGKELDVRGYIGVSLIGRSQVWQREE